MGPDIRRTLAATSRRTAAVLLATFAMGFASVAFAAWSNTPYTSLPVCTAPGSQGGVSVIPDGAGGELVVWGDYRAGNADIYVQHVRGSGDVDPAWPAGGLVVCNDPTEQAYPTIVSDGAGGAIVAWSDARGPWTYLYTVYAQHVLASGVVDPAWPVNGRPLSGVNSQQDVFALVSDGAGGAIAAWSDHNNDPGDLYAQHVLASGIVDPAWPADGRAVSTANNYQDTPLLIADGAGGAIVAWSDFRTNTDLNLYASHVRADGVVDPAWPVDGLPVCTAANDQLLATMVTDGGSGAILVWQDTRTGTNADIYAQHLLLSGIVDTGWPANGRAVCVNIKNQGYPNSAPDGAGGVLVSWEDDRTSVPAKDIYLQHVLGSGAVDPAWPADGRGVCVDANFQNSASIVSDGTGGAIVAWCDYRSQNSADLYAQHVSGGGVVDTGWPTNGRALCVAGGDQTGMALLADGSGGVVATWMDARNGNNDIYAGRVARYGYLGTPEAAITTVKDVPNDQGGRVKLAWNASYLDLAQDANLAAYDVYRSVPANLAALARAQGTLRVLREGDLPPLDAREWVAIPASATGYAWEFVQTVAANHFASQYSVLAPTAFDSLGGSNPKTAFLVLARNTSGSMFWPSRPDSGYSVDNLAPHAPAALTGQYAAGATALHWQPNTEVDFIGYRLYRGGTAGVTPDPSNFVAELPDTGYVDAAGGPWVYQLTAVDAHGNESPAATLVPTGTLGVDGGAAAAALAFAAPAPNPATLRTMLRYALPRTGAVRLAVYDAAGRQVRELATGVRAAGEHADAWDLRDEGGRTVRTGLYFARLEFAGRALVQRVVVAR